MRFDFCPDAVVEGMEILNLAMDGFWVKFGNWREKRPGSPKLGMIDQGGLFNEKYARNRDL